MVFPPSPCWNFIITALIASLQTLLPLYPGQHYSSPGRVVRGSESETEAPPSFDWFDNLFAQIPKDSINVTETK